MWSTVTSVKLTTEFARDRFQVHEIAEAGANTFAHLVLTTTSFSEIGDWTELCVDGSSSEPPVVQLGHGFGRILLAAELYVDIAHQVIAQVIANVHLLDFAVLVLGFDEDVFEEVVVVLLHLLIADVGQVGTVG